MKLAEALTTLQRHRLPEAPVFRAQLACGFTPLHLATFFAAHLQRRLPDRRVEVSGGLYGDLAGTLERLPRAEHRAAAVALEWPDLDPRLGVRQLGGWSPRDFPEILANAAARLDWMQALLECAANRFPVALSLPTLPLPPVSFTTSAQAGEFDLRLREMLFGFASRAAERNGLRLAHPQELDRISPPERRFDLKAELLTGFPYANAHADALGETLARLLAPPPPKKGLITDLDDTLWSGIAGEIGATEISWDLAHHTQLHGLYQQLLCALADQGVLLAVASRNDPATVEEAFSRADLLLPKSRCYPVEVHWRPKSESVGRILRAWNIGADSVVFVDDSPMELAEVQSVYPEMECLLFPKQDYRAAWEMFRLLRDLFGKERISGEDAVRLDSIRASAVLQADAQAAGGEPERFLERANAVLNVSLKKFPVDPRCLELVNKTNQFNLNGRRYTEAEWRESLEQEDAFLLTVSYRDKYGPLGKIAVIAGRAADSRVCVDTWVMSCRAFARRIEHRCLALLFEKFGACEAVFRFVQTEKNGPLREFFAGFLEEAPRGEFRISRETFQARRPRLFHQLELGSE